MVRTVVAVATIIMSVGIAGCSEEQPAKVKRKADHSSSLVASGAASPAESPGPTPALASLGDLVSVGDWDVKIAELAVDADTEIKRANSYNEPAKGEYVLVTFEATYMGDERIADMESDLSWSFTTSDMQVHHEADAVTPADDQSWPSEARTGGTVRGQVAFDLPADLVVGGILTVEGYNDDLDTVYADFAVEGPR